MQDTTHALTADTKEPLLCPAASLDVALAPVSRARRSIWSRYFWCALLLALLAGLTLNGPRANAQTVTLVQQPAPPAPPDVIVTKDTSTGEIETQNWVRTGNGTVIEYRDQKVDSKNRILYRFIKYNDPNTGQQTGGVEETWTYDADGNTTGHTYQEYNPNTGKWNPVVKTLNIGYQIQDIGFLAGGDFTQPEGINNSGQIAGYAMNGSNQVRAFCWQNGQMQDLGTLGGSFATAFGINNSGQIAGGAATGAVDGSGHAIYHACLWQDGEPIDLGTLGGEDSEAYGINNNGQIVGWAQISSGDMHAALWQSGQVFDLGVLSGGTEGSYATAINDSGQVVGDSSSQSGRFDAFFWQNGTMTDIGLWPFITTGSSATAINNAGIVTGRCSLYWSDNAADFTWDATAGFHFSGGLGGNSASSQSINNLGLRVGLSQPSNNAPTFYAWRFDDNHLARDLNEAIPANSGWTLAEADVVNDNGWIAGEGIMQTDSKVHAYVLVPLSVSSITLPATMHSGQTATGTVQLSGPAPEFGAVIQLTSKNKTALSVPARITIPAGATQASFTAKAGTVSRLTTVGVKASYDATAKDTMVTVAP